MKKNPRIFWQKVRRWEFWPTYIVYAPVFLYACGLAAKGRCITFFSAVNPGMKLGGLIGDSKYETLKQLPKKVLPKTLFVPLEERSRISQNMKKASLSWPIIVKPDVGMRGAGVEKIENKKQLDLYLSSHKNAVLIQEYIDLPLEFGVFYVRFPKEKNGRITSLMQREYLSVVGDGKNPLKNLILEHERAKFYQKSLFQRYEKDLNIILKKGESKSLGVIGNHCRGTRFENVCHLITPKMESSFDALSKKIRGFFYGRYDVKAASFEDLCAGNIKVIEVNGANSEPAHIYDPNMKLLDAYRDIFSHWRSLGRISFENKKRGASCPSIQNVLKILHTSL